MNKGVLGYILAFSMGAAAGAVVTWKIQQNKCTKLVDEAYAEAKELYANRKPVVKSEPLDEEDNVDVVEEPTDEPVDIRAYAAKLAKNKYVNYSNSPMPQGEPETSEHIYIIAPEEYGENEEYERIELTYYADGVLADDMDEVIEDPDDILGVGALNRFGEYEEDSIHVRNELMKRDYEVLASTMNFSEIKNKGYHHSGS